MFVVWCLLFVGSVVGARSLLIVVCCSLLFGVWLLCVDRCVLIVVCRLLFVGCCLLCVVVAY